MPHSTEWYHDDDNFELLKGEKRSGGRRRLTREYATALARDGKRGAARIALELRDCRHGHRCESGICPQCTTAARRKLIELIQTCFAETRTALLTIVPADSLHQLPRLSGLHPSALALDLERKLAAAGLLDIPTIGGLDLSWNTYEGATARTFWSPHWHLIIPDNVAEEAAERLGYFYPPSLTVHKPVEARSITVTHVRAYSYCLKSVFEARHQRILDANHREPRKAYKITPAHTKFLSLAIHLHRIGITPRLFISTKTGVPP